jgi:DNA-binding NarL/FixJ family response regulator
VTAPGGVVFRTQTGGLARHNRPMSPTVLIVDDHPGFRASARRLLSSQGYDVVGEAADGEEALAAAEALRPDLVLLDVGLPGIDGLEVAASLAETLPEAVIVLVSSRDPEDLGPLLTTAPARGFIPKAELSAAAIEKLVG